MVVCKFFLQGTCKFGSCHYEHQIPSNYNYTNFNENSQQSTSVLRQSNFVNTSNVKASATPSNIDVNTLVKSVVADMMGAEKGGQWLLSCYAPFKEKPAFPEFEDYSPEEIRLGFYESQKNGALEQYNQQLQVLLQKAVMKVKALQNPSPEVISILQNIYSSTPSSFSGIYGHNTISTTGGFSQQSSNIFSTQNKSSFGQGSGVFASTAQQSSSIFGGSSKNNIFGGSPSAQTQANIFATSSTPTQNVFGTNSFSGGQNNSFGNKQTSNIFSRPEQLTNSGNIFGGGTSDLPTFSNTQPSSNVFASPQSVQPQNVFMTQNSGQQNKQAPQNIFKSQDQGIPNNKVQQSGFFSQQNIPPSNYSASVFGNSVNTKISFEPTANKQDIDVSIYSKPEELNADEKRWFESSELDIFNIPDKPPTYDMCFK